MSSNSCNIQEYNITYKKPEVLEESVPTDTHNNCFACLFKKTKKRSQSVDSTIASNGFAEKIETHILRDRHVNKNLSQCVKVGRLSLIGDESIYPVLRAILDSFLTENDRTLFKHGIIKLVLEKIRFIICKMIELGLPYHDAHSHVRADRILEFKHPDDLESWYSSIGSDVMDLWTDANVPIIMNIFVDIFNVNTKYLMYLIPKLVQRQYVVTADDCIQYNFSLFGDKIYYEDEQRWVFHIVEITPEKISNYVKFLSEYFAAIDSIPTNVEEIIYCIDVKKFMSNLMVQNQLTNFFSFHLAQLDMLMNCANVYAINLIPVIKKIAFMNLEHLDKVRFENFGPDFYVVNKETLKRLIDEYLSTTSLKKNKMNLEFVFENSDTLGQHIVKLAVFRLNLKNAGFIY
jgi:hypothetical protein